MYQVYQEYEGEEIVQFEGSYQECQEFIEKFNEEQSEYFGNEFPEAFVKEV